MEFIAATEVAVVGFFQVSSDTLLATPPRARNVLLQGNHSSQLLADDTALEVGVKGDSHSLLSSCPLGPLTFKTFPVSKSYLSHTHCFLSLWAASPHLWMLWSSSQYLQKECLHGTYHCPKRIWSVLSYQPMNRQGPEWIQSISSSNTVYRILKLLDISQCTAF